MKTTTFHRWLRQLVCLFCLTATQGMVKAAGPVAKAVRVAIEDASSPRVANPFTGSNFNLYLANPDVQIQPGFKVRVSVIIEMFDEAGNAIDALRPNLPSPAVSMMPYWFDQNSIQQNAGGSMPTYLSGHKFTDLNHPVSSDGTPAPLNADGSIIYWLGLDGQMKSVPGEFVQNPNPVLLNGGSFKVHPDVNRVGHKLVILGVECTVTQQFVNYYRNTLKAFAAAGVKYTHLIYVGPGMKIDSVLNGGNGCMTTTSAVPGVGTPLIYCGTERGAASPLITKIEKSDLSAKLTFTGRFGAWGTRVLEQAPSLTGPWTTVTDGMSTLLRNDGTLEITLAGTPQVPDNSSTPPRLQPAAQWFWRVRTNCGPLLP